MATNKEKLKNAVDELKGNKIGKLTVINYQYTHKKNGFMFLCLCDCGNEVVRCASYLRRCINFNTDCNCGCVCYGRKPTHGCTNTRLYNIWDGIKERCRDKSQKNYGGRGISICKEWEEDFLVFKKWALENGYKDDLTIDRIDNDGNYEPYNCRWTTMKEQSKNKRNSVNYFYNGKYYNAKELGEFASITSTAFVKRIKKGMSVKEAVETPKNLNYDRYRKTN